MSARMTCARKGPLDRMYDAISLPGRPTRPVIRLSIIPADDVSKGKGTSTKPSKGCSQELLINNFSRGRVNGRINLFP